MSATVTCPAVHLAPCLGSWPVPPGPACCPNPANSSLPTRRGTGAGDGPPTVLFWPKGPGALLYLGYSWENDISDSDWGLLLATMAGGVSGERQGQGHTRCLMA